METLKRSLVTLITLPVLIFILYDNTYHAVYFFLCIFAISLLAYFELMHLFEQVHIRNTYFPLFALIVLYFALFYHQYSYIGPIFFLTLIVESIFWFFNKNVAFESIFVNILSSLFMLFYLGIMFGSLVLLRQIHVEYPFSMNTGSLHVVILLAGTWMCDIGAYFGGRLLGRTRLNLSISPNKTLEGFISGVMFSIVAILLATYLTGIKFHFYMLLLPFVTIVGDLFESMIKRMARQKDSNNLIPGHGGILDVFDALIFTSPMYYFCILPWVIGG